MDLLLKGLDPLDINKIINDPGKLSSKIILPGGTLVRNKHEARSFVCRKCSDENLVRYWLSVHRPHTYAKLACALGAMNPDTHIGQYVCIALLCRSFRTSAMNTSTSSTLIPNSLVKGLTV